MLQFSALHIMSNCDTFKCLFSYFLHLSVLNFAVADLISCDIKVLSKRIFHQFAIFQRKYFAGVMKLPRAVHFSPLRLYDHSFGLWINTANVSCFGRVHVGLYYYSETRHVILLTKSENGNQHNKHTVIYN